jgi:hypothetical protein
MYRELYEKGVPPGESQIVAELIEQAIILASVDLDLTIQYLADGLMATVHLKPPHNAPWNIMWTHEQSKMIDTGMDPIPSLADPHIQELLTESMRKIYIHLHAFCHCPACRMKGIL